ncbi:MAG: EF-P lysine aminoacylase GenX, partial [Proteobacteria bacterium]
TWDDLYFLIWLNDVEPNLPKDRPLIIYHYPPSQAALAVTEIGDDGNRWAKRFEFYIAGIELGNAFEELTDPIEQRARFENDQKVRRETYGDTYPVSPIDEDFLNALAEGMPPSGGIAVGVDRMVQLFANEPELAKTLWLESEPGKIE